MIQAFDLDGVLCVAPPKRGKRWGAMNGSERRAAKRADLEWYRSAAKLHSPSGAFHVISARKFEPDVFEATLQWLFQHFGEERILSINLLNGPRTVVNVIRFKSRVLEGIGATVFTEDNRAILAGIRRACPEVALREFHEGWEGPLPFLEAPARPSCPSEGQLLPDGSEAAKTAFQAPAKRL